MTFYRTITALVQVPADATNVVLAFAEQGDWQGGTHSVTSVVSAAVKQDVGIQTATITGGVTTLQASAVLPGAVATATGTDTITLNAGNWLVTFFAVLEPAPGPPTVDGAHVTSVPPSLEASISGGSTTLQDSFLVPWTIPD